MAHSERALAAGRRVIASSCAAEGLLAPELTAGDGHPLLYSQCQPIHARSLVPLQDAPRTRLRYSADLRVPADLVALMPARRLGREIDGSLAIERFEMPQPISPYLLALVVGDFVDRQPDLQRQRRALLAQRRLHHLCGATHRRDPLERRGRGAGVGARTARAGRRSGALRNEGRPELTRLRTELDGVDPDIAFSISCSSQVAQPCSAPRSTRLQIIEELAGAPPPDSVASKWRPIEWQLYLESLPSDVIVEDLAALDTRFHLTQASNYDVLEKWLTQGHSRWLRPWIGERPRARARRRLAARSYA